MKEFIYLIIEEKRPPLNSDPYEIVGIEYTKERALKKEKRGYTVIRLETAIEIFEEETKCH